MTMLAAFQCANRRQKRHKLKHEIIICKGFPFRRARSSFHLVSVIPFSRTIKHIIECRTMVTERQRGKRKRAKKKEKKTLCDFLRDFSC